ncbi:MAG: alpha/beta fold hydrolase [Thermoguttaceae bacterium]|nr:alpha/beta fold hydrolase [Thermoguttaceae bacterium]
MKRHSSQPDLPYGAEKICAWGTRCASFRLMFLFLALALVFLSGCATTRLTKSRLPSPSMTFARKTYYSIMPDSVEYSEATRLGLSTLNLERLASQDPKAALLQLEEAYNHAQIGELASIMAEIAFKEGKRQEEHRFVSDPSCRKMTEWYLRAAKYAYTFLFDPRLEAKRNPYSPIFQNVCLIYNESTKRLLRLAGCGREKTDFITNGGIQIDLPDQPRDLQISMHSREWKAEDFDWFCFSSDFEVTGLKNRFLRYGLGVPLVAKCREVCKRDIRFRYCLPEHCVPMTALLVFENDVPKVEFIDTLECLTAQIGNVSIPLEIDHTTPLAYGFDLTVKSDALDGATLGLLNPDSLLKETQDGNRQLKGFYMPQAYDSQKIPVVMVHGLWSSAMTWMEMYNTLTNLPEVRAKYQFWFYFYPNGQPFWVSAVQFRDDLEKLREELDPNRENANLDQIVLIGHSMGGLIASMQTLDSQEILWNLITSTPAEDLPGDPESIQEVARWFHLKPNPSIACVITLGTPFHGSVLANSAVRNLTGMVGHKASLVETNLKQFRKQNKKFIQNDELLKYETAIDSLQKETIFWDGLAQCEPADWVEYRNVIAKLTQREGASSDGVVSIESATQPWGTAQTTYVTALHREITKSPEAIKDVATILMERLNPAKNPKFQTQSPPQTSPLGESSEGS